MRLPSCVFSIILIVSSSNWVLTWRLWSLVAWIYHPKMHTLNAQVTFSILTLEVTQLMVSIFPNMLMKFLPLNHYLQHKDLHLFELVDHISRNQISPVPLCAQISHFLHVTCKILSLLKLTWLAQNFALLSKLPEVSLLLHLMHTAIILGFHGKWRPTHLY